MADDGMLLNFSIPETVIKPEVKIKGGSWRDRLSAKKLAQGKRAPRSRVLRTHGAGQSGDNPNNVHIGERREPSSHPNKRPRTDGADFRPSTSANGQPRGGPPGGGRGPKPKQIISSLFSYNPISKEAEEGDNRAEDQADDVEVKPSNAPLIDGIEDFTALGLAPTLAAHLLAKMELKAPTAIQKASIPQLVKEDSDAFIQAQTGSGKTLAYLLPLVQRIINLKNSGAISNNNGKGSGDSIHRDAGLFAIVLAPTRELCKQISVVLENLLRCAHWIVAGTVIGGEKKKSEKARLRKGLNILVATPGRLADHLDNTKVLDVSNVRWLILDEGDRLMDLGFEEEIHGIVKKLDARQRPSSIIGLPTKRTTVLCSATLKMNVQRLGEISLKDAVHIKADPTDTDGKDGNEEEEKDTFTVPAQLQQSYIVAAAKLRLVTLTALMKRTFMRKGSVMKAIIFVSCADSVEFHFEVFTRKDDSSATTETQPAESSDESDTEESDAEEKEKSNANDKTSQHGTIGSVTAFSNPSNPVTIHKLHGSLPQHVRTSTLGAFAKSKEAAVLICTDVASRGLDLPNIDLVVEYDPAFSSDEHLHRIGRTARLGRDGRAIVFLLPGSEEGYVDVLKRSYRDGGKALSRMNANDVLKRGFGGNTDATSKDWEEKATDWQLDVERWALENPQSLELARRAFQSHIRAYATHVAAERNMFNIKGLHLGHLAKAFALRDRPSKINVPGLRQSKDETKKGFKADRRASGKSAGNNATENKKRKATGGDDDVPRETNNDDAVRRMRAKMRELTGSGASEFNLA
ncbi:ATP dependent RNA helicase (Dbp7), putative [Talaromyces stipitatus ATCC 10500]|uniref:ATP-dependent RNA helicase n=1 Tax=Talaromyces stipitatus (strain ATCC 10500 / CBS 375.48 / QM 6759 / NRRL 1006) TaxID=441959 RepID=B8LSX0_TALSN|nr:ATP dependent RNA helicase (Dbp7), putative [Talaromyces stipitatus ATCC 10500]EED22966.1 ATP dependent RNA helicase (Dbp7), putative [Talaromyces stipitatus ATCC 10500]